MDAFRARGATVVGHGRSNAERQGTLPEAEERALIAEATAVLAARRAGRRRAGSARGSRRAARPPTCWRRPATAYLLDWCHDDQPTWFSTRGGGRILSVPYPQELNDIPSIVAGARIQAASSPR